LNWKRTLSNLWVASFFVAVGFSMVIPFLPLYIEELGIHRLEDIERWSGLTFSIPFMTSIIFQPIWGKIAVSTGLK
jgi:DHA1 family multidrug resistance protein-like MFS transporter